MIILAILGVDGRFCHNKMRDLKKKQKDPESQGLNIEQREYHRSMTEWRFLNTHLSRTAKSLFRSRITGLEDNEFKILTDFVKLACLSDLYHLLGQSRYSPSLVVCISISLNMNEVKHIFIYLWSFVSFSEKWSVQICSRVTIFTECPANISYNMPIIKLAMEKFTLGKGVRWEWQIMKLLNNKWYNMII